MPLAVSDGDWKDVDSWWGCFSENERFMFAAPHTRAIDETWKERNWGSVDTLWEAFEADRDLLLADRRVRTLQDEGNCEAWDTVDEFWEGYAADQREDIAELRRLVKALGEAWRDGSSQFNSDPLTTNWRPESKYEGPLRTTSDEEDWSQWLAHLLRTSSGAFAHELLGTPDRSPVTVRREVVFFGERSNRRADILVEYEDVAVSIEVKNGDEHYGKTPHTAGLIERHDDRDWSHILLLQKRKLPRLQQTFGDELDLSDEDNPTIRSDQSGNIEVRFWQDVSRSLRWMLLDGCEPNSHWEASAYLFITLIEQRLLGFHSSSFVDPTTTTESTNSADVRQAGSTTDPTPNLERGGDTGVVDDGVGAMDLHRLVAADLDSQVAYLRAVLNEDSTHE